MVSGFKKTSHAFWRITLFKLVCFYFFLFLYNFHGDIITPINEEKSNPLTLSLSWIILTQTSSFGERSRRIDLDPDEFVVPSPAKILATALPLWTSAHRSSSPGRLTTDALNRYKPDTGARNIPVFWSNPFPLLVTILGNWTAWPTPMCIWWVVVSAVNPIRGLCEEFASFDIKSSLFCTPT